MCLFIFFWCERRGVRKTETIAYQLNMMKITPKERVKKLIIFVDWKKNWANFAVSGFKTVTQSDEYALSLFRIHMSDCESVSPSYIPPKIKKNEKIHSKWKRGWKYISYSHKTNVRFLLITSKKLETGSKSSEVEFQSNCMILCFYISHSSIHLLLLKYRILWDVINNKFFVVFLFQICCEFVFCSRIMSHELKIFFAHEHDYGYDKIIHVQRGDDLGSENLFFSLQFRNCLMLLGFFCCILH